MERLVIDEEARLDPENYQRRLRDFLAPTADSTPALQAKPNKLYVDNFKLVDRFNAEASQVSVGWRLKGEKQRFLLGAIQFALLNAYALWRDSATIANVVPDKDITVTEFVARVGKEVWDGGV